MFLVVCLVATVTGPTNAIECSRGDASQRYFRLVFPYPKISPLTPVTASLSGVASSFRLPLGESFVSAIASSTTTSNLYNEILFYLPASMAPTEFSLSPGTSARRPTPTKPESRLIRGRNMVRSSSWKAQRFPRSKRPSCFARGEHRGAIERVASNTLNPESRSSRWFSRSGELISVTFEQT